MSYYQVYRACRPPLRRSPWKSEKSDFHGKNRRRLSLPRPRTSNALLTSTETGCMMIVGARESWPIHVQTVGVMSNRHHAYCFALAPLADGCARALRTRRLRRRRCARSRPGCRPAPCVLARAAAASAALR